MGEELEGLQEAEGQSVVYEIMSSMYDRELCRGNTSSHSSVDGESLIGCITR